MLCHNRGGGDGVDGSDVGKGVRHMCGGIVAVHGFQLSSQSNSSLNCLGVKKYGDEPVCSPAMRVCVTMLSLAAIPLYHKTEDNVNLLQDISEKFA